MGRDNKTRAVNQNPDSRIEKIINVMEAWEKINEKIADIYSDIIEEVKKRGGNAYFIRELLEHLKKERNPSDDRKLLDFLFGLKSEIFTKICAILKRTDPVGFHNRLGRYMS